MGVGNVKRVRRILKTGLACSTVVGVVLSKIFSGASRAK